MATNQKDLTNIFASDFIKHTKEDMLHIAQSYMRICFRLYEAKNNKYYEALGYPDIYSCAEKELDISRSVTVRMIEICKRFSQKNGFLCSMFIDKKYEQFNYSQLCELVTMKDKDISLIKPEMSVKQIREIKNNIRNKFSDTVNLSKNLLEQKKPDYECSTGATSHHEDPEEIEDAEYEIIEDDKVPDKVCNIEKREGFFKKDIKDLIKDVESEEIFYLWLNFEGIDYKYYRYDFKDSVYVICLSKLNSYEKEFSIDSFYIFYDFKKFDFDAALVSERDFINNLMMELNDAE